ncbi:transposon Ty3-G Gag-Pol polyprotein [Trichonephila clavata]|uniref:Transposon Ty3-G Gag-Pol polyprotein n=1 Tax=Trichonephila clavata TaxID=2740835 RepID=A0A8X6LZM2_TRICU|nr:transposon Ty3-G Gag-Pol polyprotein [Trichonephila clavata]
MQRRSESHNEANSLLLELLLQQLPPNSQSILASIQPLTAQKASEVADRILEVTPAQEVKELRRSRSFSRNRFNFRKHGKRPKPTASNLCWYHYKFASNARKYIHSPVLSRKTSTGKSSGDLCLAFDFRSPFRSRSGSQATFIRKSVFDKLIPVQLFPLNSTLTGFGKSQGETIINENGVTIKSKPKCIEEISNLSVLPINLSPDGFENNIAPDIPQICQSNVKTITPNFVPGKKVVLHEDDQKL